MNRGCEKKGRDVFVLQESRNCFSLPNIYRSLLGNTENKAGEIIFLYRIVGSSVEFVLGISPCFFLQLHEHADGGIMWRCVKMRG